MAEKLDRETFGSIVEKHSKAIFNAAFRIVNNYEDAMDITQNTFIKVYERLDRYDPSHDIFSWLYKIAVNEAINCAKRNSRFAELDPEAHVHAGDPETDFIHNETSARLQEALMTLPLDYRTVLVLRHSHNLSYREIGAVLEIPEKTVKSRLYTGRQLLRDLLVRAGYTQ